MDKLGKFHVKHWKDGEFCIAYCVELGIKTSGYSFAEAFNKMGDEIKEYQRDNVKKMDKGTSRKWEEGKGFGEDGEVYLAPMDMLTGREEDKDKWDVGIWGLEGVTFDNEGLAHIYFALLKLTKLIENKSKVGDSKGEDEVMMKLKEQMRLVEKGEFSGIAVFASVKSTKEGGKYHAEIDNAVHVINCDERETFCTLRGISDCMDGLCVTLIRDIGGHIETKAVAEKVEAMKASLKKGVDNLSELERQIGLIDGLLHTLRERVRVLKQLEAEGGESEAGVKGENSEGGTEEVVGGKKDDEVGGKEGEVVGETKK